jgi:hypothetical protein
MRRRVLAAICATVLLVAVALATSCSKSAALAADCSINSDCNSPLICAFGRCHNECTATRDCPTGERERYPPDPDGRLGLPVGG